MNDYDLTVSYHLGKADVVANVLSRKYFGSMLAMITFHKSIVEEIRRMDFN